MAHYIVNRHPEMFSVLIVKQCNFSAEVMNASRARRYTDMPVGIYYTENDFGICRRESAEAVTWYKQLGFKNLTSGVIDRYGHERMPEVAADLFAKYIGAPPKTPPKRLVRIQTQDMPGQHVASANSRPPGVGPEAFASPPQTTRNRPDNVNYNEIKPAAAERTVQRPPASRPPRPRIATPPPPRRQTNTRTVEPNHLNDQRVASAPQRNNYNPPPNQRTTAVQPPRVQRPVPPPPQRQVQPARATQNPRIAQSNPPVTRSYPKNPPPTAARRNEPPRTQPPANVMAQRNAARRNVPPPTRTPGPAGTVGIDLSSTIGLSPLMVGYSVNLPRDQLRGADILWTDNGEPFSQSPSGQRLLTKAGDHEIGVLVVTSKGMELRQTKKVTVYPREQVSGGLAQR